MMDAEDRAAVRDVLLPWVHLWVPRAVGVAVAVLGSAGLLGAAWRLFELVRG